MTVARIHLKAPVMLLFIAIFTCLPSCINLSNIQINIHIMRSKYTVDSFYSYFGSFCCFGYKIAIGCMWISEASINYAAQFLTIWICSSQVKLFARSFDCIQKSRY